MHEPVLKFLRVGGAARDAVGIRCHIAKHNFYIDGIGDVLAKIQWQFVGCSLSEADSD